MQDLYGMIARARASMMLRGYADLVLHLGPDAEAQLCRDAAPFSPYDDLPVNRRRFMLSMLVQHRQDMEGWAVLPSS